MQVQVALLALSVEDGGRAELGGAAAKAQMRRFVCGFFEEDEARFGGGTKVRRGMLRQVRESGLEVQRAAKGAAKQLEADMWWSTASSGRRSGGWRTGGWRSRGGRALRGSGSCRRSGWRAREGAGVHAAGAQAGAHPLLRNNAVIP